MFKHVQYMYAAMQCVRAYVYMCVYVCVCGEEGAGCNASRLKSAICTLPSLKSDLVKLIVNYQKLVSLFRKI